MKKVILFFSAAISLFFFSCNNECEKWKQELTSKDSVILARYKQLTAAQVLPKDAKTPANPTPLAVYSMDDAKTMIQNFMNSPAPTSASAERGNAFLSDSLILAMIMNGPTSANGIYVHRGMDQAGAVHWLAWESVPNTEAGYDNVSVYELPAISCICKPCCAVATDSAPTGDGN